jgi:AsmA family protein
MGAANGDAVLAMAGGSVSGLMISLANLHIRDALVLYITGDDRIPIRCALERSHLGWNRIGGFRHGHDM